MASADEQDAVPKRPIVVQIEFHPDSAEAVAMAHSLHRALNGDPSVPGLRIPTTFTPKLTDSRPPSAALADDSERIIVVLLADDHMVADGQKQTSGQTWPEYAARLKELCGSPGRYFMPVQLSQHAWPLHDSLSGMNALRAWVEQTPEKRSQLILQRLMDLMIRLLRNGAASFTEPATTIFLSHAKAELDTEPRVVQSLMAFLDKTLPENTWFDVGDITTGSVFANRIEAGVKDSSLIAVVTDSYSSRAWCRREILLAKKYGRPAIIVDAIRDREVRRFPYAGNVPVLRWVDSPERVYTLLLRETLRHEHALALLHGRAGPEDLVLPGAPELITILQAQAKSVLYPDPPVGLEEQCVLELTGVRAETPLERHARRYDLKSRNWTVALSFSLPADLAVEGLAREHFEDALLEVSRYLLLSGVKLCYGGHLEEGGYTVQLADLVREPLVDQLRNRSSTRAAEPDLICYNPWPVQPDVHRRARLGNLVRIIDGRIPAKLQARFEAVVLDSGKGKPDTPALRYAYARGLREMRGQQSQHCQARIILGGQMTGSAGPLPGVLEEALLSFESKRPVFILGGFGGCGRWLVDALNGDLDAHIQQLGSATMDGECRDLEQEFGSPWKDSVELMRSFRDADPRRYNGLSAEQNRVLGSTRNVERAVGLILEGLGRIRPQADGAGGE